MALDPVLSISNPAAPIAVSAQQWRRLDIASTMAHDAHSVAARAGVASGMSCTVSGLTVTLSPGSAIVTPTAGANGSYRVAAGSNTSVTLAARDASFARNDLIVLRVYDASVDTSNRWEAALEVVTGTAAASPSDPTIPPGALLLYRAIVPVSGTVTLIDLRTWTSGLGGVITCLSTDRPSGGGLRVGQHIFEFDSGEVRVWTGAEWRLVSPGAAQSYTPSWTTSGTELAVGNGAKEGRWRYLGNGLFWWSILIARGSTTNVGIGTYAFSLPVGQRDWRQCAGTGYAVRGSEYPLAVRPLGAGSVAAVLSSNQRLASNNPSGWSSGDMIYLSGTCEGGA